MDMQTAETIEYMASVEKLTRDLKNASVELSLAEVRFLVDAYYQMQNDRIRATHQERTLEESDEPHSVVSWLASQRETLENQIKRALDAYSAAQPVGQWARSITGIGPVIASGLIAHIDITDRPTAGHIWRFAGLDPTVEWKAKTKRPWNADLKRLCWIISESFVKVSGHERDVYGKVYKARKALEIERNDAGRFADQAAAMLVKKKFRDETVAKKAYASGRLPPAHIHARATRYATKLFLSHLHAVMWWVKYNSVPPKPYILTRDSEQHVHFIEPPNIEMFPGLREAFRVGVSQGV